MVVDWLVDLGECLGSLGVGVGVDPRLRVRVMVMVRVTVRCLSAQVDIQVTPGRAQTRQNKPTLPDFYFGDKD